MYELAARRATRRSVGFSVMFAVMSAVVLAAGCVEVPEPVRGFRPAELSDFYVPPSFDVVDAREWNGVPQLRHWRGTYTGTESLGTLEPSYVREMPRYGWQLGRIQRAGEDTRVLTFYKGDQQAEVTLSRRYDKTIKGMGTKISAHVGPRPLESFEPGEELEALRRGGQTTTPNAETVAGPADSLSEPAAPIGEDGSEPTRDATTAMRSEFPRI